MVAINEDQAKFQAGADKIDCGPIGVFLDEPESRRVVFAARKRLGMRQPNLAPVSALGGINRGVMSVTVFFESGKDVECAEAIRKSDLERGLRFCRQTQIVKPHPL